DAVDADLVGVAKREIGPRSPVEGLRFAVRIDNLNLADRDIRAQDLWLARLHALLAGAVADVAEGIKDVAEEEGEAGEQRTVGVPFPFEVENGERHDQIGKG